MNSERDIIKSLDSRGIKLSERLGQHILIDEAALDFLSMQAVRHSSVIEIGAGPGNLTRKLAQRVDRVVAIEIDPRFRPYLDEVRTKSPNVEVLYRDVLSVDLGKISGRGQLPSGWQIIADLPFHITEPFLSKLVGLSIGSSILILGGSAAREIMEDERSPYYGKLSLIAQTFFDIRQISNVPKTSFYPQPRTDAILIELTPKEKEEIQANPANFVFACLIRGANKYGLVINEMKQALVDASLFAGRGSLSKKEANRRDRSEIKRQLRSIVLHNGIPENDDSNKRKHAAIISQADALEKISRMGIETGILQKPFFALNGPEIRILARAVRNIF